MSCFYIHKYLPSDPKDMIDGPRIAEVPNPYLELPPDKGEGPYQSLSQLKKKSIIYKELKRKDPKRAESIAKKRFIVRAHEVIFFPTELDKTFRMMIYRILTHSTNGKVNSKGVRGIHFYDPEKVNITKMLRFDKKTGVFEAEIEVLNLNTGEYIKKENKSSFFPQTWSKQRLIIECYQAYRSMAQINDQVYRGTTCSGIVLEFLYSNRGKFASVYPVLEPDKE
ncbi:MAG TPA: EndoU domain-containing protein [Saprospiraceae bacterium]|nr:EndoU domain-containing protein [Saprospiraceae bacterium]